MPTLNCPLNIICCVCNNLVIDNHYHLRYDKYSCIIPFYWMDLDKKKQDYNYEDDSEKVKIFCSPVCSLVKYQQKNEDNDNV